MYTLSEISGLHLEISSKCNANCPLCPRNFYGYPYNDGYIEHNMTLYEAKQIFCQSFVAQLSTILINGNFGDAVMNPETIDIIRYFRQCSSTVKISMSTNAGARNLDYWQELARLDVIVAFCIDGLEDTHSIYRQNTSYHTVVKNAEIFIAAGGQAIWKMIDFDHNKHQQKLAEKISAHMGFKKFELVDTGRNQSPIFDKNKQLSGIIGTPVEVHFDKLWKTRTTDEVLLEDIIVDRVEKPISCAVKKTKQIYVSSTGDVYPCCFLGFNPHKYGHGNYHAAANAQFKHMVHENNALKYDLAHCICWFAGIEKTWNIPTFSQGRLVICNDVCGV